MEGAGETKGNTAMIILKSGGGGGGGEGGGAEKPKKSKTGSDSNDDNMGISPKTPTSNPKSVAKESRKDSAGNPKQNATGSPVAKKAEVTKKVVQMAS
jgi:hypothetical protein